MDVRMELSKILITELGEQQVIFLKEKDGPRGFPVMIGIQEALAIRHRLNGSKFPRPLTHDLLAGVIEAMGGKLERIVIHDLHKHTFIAKLCIRRGEELIEADSRPSDAIALGSAFNTPIYVAEHVLDQVTREPATMEERLDLLRERQQMLQGRIAELSRRLADPEFVQQTPDELLQQLRRQNDEMQSDYDAIERVLRKLE